MSRKFSPLDSPEKRRIFKTSFIASLPVMMGYTTMGFVAGVLLAAKGKVILSPVWAFLTSSLWVTGTMSIACVGPVSERMPFYALALMTLAVNFRYAFYGFSMLSRWKQVPILKKLYLILMLTDENYALEASCKIEDEDDNLRYCIYLSVLNHSYWIGGVTLGAIVVCVLSVAISPERIRACTNGMEFSMAALFIVILTDQMRDLVVSWKKK